jgi:YVTN family beta-propeller protein
MKKQTSKSKKSIGLLLALGLSAALANCGGESTSPPPPPPPPPPPANPFGTTVSSSLALTKDDKLLWVVNQDADSVTVLDTATRKIVAEVPLGDKPPAADPTTKRFEPAVLPRALTLVSDKKVYIAGETANKVYVVDADMHTVLTSIDVPAAPVSVAAAPDGSAVYVVSHEAGKVTKIDTKTDKITGSVDVTEHPWGATVSADGKSLYVTHLLLDPGVSLIDTASLKLTGKTKLADQAKSVPFNKLAPNGVARGLYAAVPRPMSDELWVPHLILAVDTAQPDLDFQSTVFPTLSTVKADGSGEGRRLIFQPMDVPGAKGAFADSVSGPHAVAFTPDGKLALVALAQSEDVMVFDAVAGTELALVRPIPSAMLEGIVVDHTGKRAFVDGRNTHDVTVLKIDPENTLIPASVDGKPILRLGVDPMPPDLRHGQRLFYTANSAAFPITKNFWVACATCHIEGGSDAVTWLFKEGPRDTPSNAAGPINTGFLLHQALRSDVNQYDETIRDEQGGSYDLKKPAQKADLDALAAYVNYAIPVPQNPHFTPGTPLSDAQKHGKATFDMVCASCHSGAFYTDSALGNPGLDFAKTITLHDVGTCVLKGDFPDKPGTDVDGHMHTACDFDTPTLRGIFATPPYFHDGSAKTLNDVVDRLPASAKLPKSDKDDLVQYLLTL